MWSRCRKSAVEVMPDKLQKFCVISLTQGGRHADNTVDLQEFMIMPVGAKSWKEALRWCSEVFHTLSKVLHTSSVGDEGGYAPNLKKDEDALKVIVQAIEEAGYKPGEDFKIAIDGAVSDWYNEEDKCYHLPKRGTVMTSEQMVDMWEGFVDKYPIISIEDGMGENDWEGWQLMTKRLGHKIQIVGPVRHQHRAHQEGHCSGRSKRSPHQGKPDRHPDRDSRRYPDGSPRRLDGSCLPPLRRDRGYHHCRPRSCAEHLPDKDRRSEQKRAYREVQPAYPH